MQGHILAYVIGKIAEAMMTPQAREHDFVERVARAWASIDGRGHAFDEQYVGLHNKTSDVRYSEYLAWIRTHYREQAESLLKRIDFKPGDRLPGGFAVVQAECREPAAMAYYSHSIIPYAK
jgi:hypothetical protein